MAAASLNDREYGSHHIQFATCQDFFWYCSGYMIRCDRRVRNLHGTTQEVIGLGEMFCLNAFLVSRKAEAEHFCYPLLRATQRPAPRMATQ